MTLEDPPAEKMCGYCGGSIYWDDDVVSRRTGKKIPLDFDTGEFHHCQEYREAKVRGEEEKLFQQSDAYKQRSKENLAQSRIKRYALRRVMKRTDEQRNVDSAISVNENPSNENLQIEYRLPDSRDW